MDMDKNELEELQDALREAEEQKSEWVKESHEAGLTTPEALAKVRLAVNTFDDTGEAMQILVDTGAIYNKAVLQLFVTLGGYFTDGEATAHEEPLLLS